MTSPSRDDEDVLAGGFRDEPLAVQQDRLVETLVHGLLLRQRPS